MNVTPPTSPLQYDALGRRVQDDAGTQLYYSSAWQVIEERSGGVMQAQYVWSPVYVDALVERDAGGQRLYVQQDANWNVTAVDGPGVPVWAPVERYVYDPYGAPTVLDPTGWTPRTSAYGWIYLHQGGRYDTFSGLYNFRNRDYSATLGRWMEQDPVGFQAGDLNLYRLELGNPLSKNDPSGLKTCGPDVTDWFKKDIAIFRAEAKKARAEYDTIMEFAKKNKDYGGAVVTATADLIKKFMTLALIADFKKRKDKDGNVGKFFNVPGCPDAADGTVSLCGKCVQTNQLGNIILGIIASDMGLINEARQYAQGKLKLPFDIGPQGPDVPWTAPGEGYREQAFDIGVEYARWSDWRTKFKGKQPDLCDLMGRNTKGPIDKNCGNLPPCNATFQGPQTDVKAPPAVDKSGN